MNRISLKNILEFPYETQLEARNWRNLSYITKNMQIEYIDEDTHKKYLQKLSIEKDKFIAFIILYDNSPCGLVYLSNINNVSCDWGIYIFKLELYGKGIASFALNETISYCKNILKLKEVHLEVLSFNSSAIKLYEKNGFKYIKTHSIIKDGKSVDVHSYTLFL